MQSELPQLLALLQDPSAGIHCQHVCGVHTYVLYEILVPSFKITSRNQLISVRPPVGVSVCRDSYDTKFCLLLNIIYTYSHLRLSVSLIIIMTAVINYQHKIV